MCIFFLPRGLESSTRKTFSKASVLLIVVTYQPQCEFDHLKTPVIVDVVVHATMKKMNANTEFQFVVNKQKHAQFAAGNRNKFPEPKCAFLRSPCIMPDSS